MKFCFTSRLVLKGRRFWRAVALIFICNLLLATAIDSAVFAKGCEQLYDGVLRLHILANSDKEEDQALKLKVRDRVLQTAHELGLGHGCDSMEEILQQAEEMLPQLVEAAQNEVYQNGSNQQVRACVTTMYFDTREYESFTMPAGEYRTVRFTLGSGQGHNWWCVLFPQMCLPVAFEEPVEADFSPAQLRVLNASPKYEPRFALLELLQKEKSAGDASCQKGPAKRVLSELAEVLFSPLNRQSQTQNEQDRAAQLPKSEKDA